MKRLFAALFFAAAVFASSGTAALACDTVTATITDSSTNTDYAHGGVLMIVNSNFNPPIAGSDDRDAGGRFSVTFGAASASARAVVMLYTPEGRSPLAPIVRNVAVTGGTGLCLHITQTVNSGNFLSMTGPDSVAF